MTSMTTTTGPVTSGVDTHGETNHAAVLDQIGRQLGDREFPTTPTGYRQLLAWLGGHGVLERVGLEGTGAYSAALARHLRTQDVTVVEVDRADRNARRAKGKSDPLDAYAAARAALSETATERGRAATASSRRSERCGSPAAARSRPAPRPPTSSRRCWSPPRPSCESNYAT